MKRLQARDCELTNEISNGFLRAQVQDFQKLFYRNPDVKNLIQSEKNKRGKNC